jgi:hypothetical protein
VGELSGEGRVEAFRWTAEKSIAGLGVPSGKQAFSLARAVSGDGSFVVGFESVPFVDDGGFCDCCAYPFIWNRTNGRQLVHEILRNLGIELDLLLLTGASRVSDDGRTLVGFGGVCGPPWVATLDCPGDDDCDAILDINDNCPGLRTMNIDDADGNGVGNECECGDQTGDGLTDMNDIMAIVDVAFGEQEASPLCDTNDDDVCNVLDVLGVHAKMFGEPAYCARYPAP